MIASVSDENVYKEGNGNYEKCSDTITASSAFPGTAILEMMNAGYPQNMLVIGKPGTKQDAGPGFMSTTTLSQCVSLAKSKGWNAGVMVWEVSWMQVSFLLLCILMQMCLVSGCLC